MYLWRYYRWVVRKVPRLSAQMQADTSPQLIYLSKFGCRLLLNIPSFVEDCLQGENVAREYKWLPRKNWVERGQERVSHTRRGKEVGSYTLPYSCAETSISIRLYDRITHQRHTTIKMERFWNGPRSRLLYPHLYRENRDRSNTLHQPRGVGAMRWMGQRISVQRTHPSNDTPPIEKVDCRCWDKEENNLPLLQAFIRGHPNLFRHRYLHRIEDANA